MLSMAKNPVNFFSFFSIFFQGHQPNSLVKTFGVRFTDTEYTFNQNLYKITILRLFSKGIKNSNGAAVLPVVIIGPAQLVLATGTAISNQSHKWVTATSVELATRAASAILSAIAAL